MRHRSAPHVLARALGGAALVAVLGAACHADGDASEPLTLAEQRALVAADSAAGDTAAMVALPPALHVLRLEPYLTNAHIAATDGAFCHIVDAPGAGGGLGLPSPGERRRIELPFPDSSLIQIAVRTDASLVGLDLVELHYYAPGLRQVDRRSFQWDSETDVTYEFRFPPELNGRTERAPQPAGGPVPRALRALGRRALQLDCVPAPPKPADSTRIVLPSSFEYTAEVPRP